jgi:hypothetical protein
MLGEPQEDLAAAIQDIFRWSTMMYKWKAADCRFLNACAETNTM